jgi:hypothetical protein
MNAPIPVWQLANWLHRSAGTHKALAMLEAYFDESGTEGEATIAAIAGYVASAEEWRNIEKPWQCKLNLLSEWSVKTFHMTDCISGTGEYERVPFHIRKAHLSGQSLILRNAEIQPIWSWIIVEDWHDVITDKAFLARFPKPLDLCFDFIVRKLRAWAARKANGELVVPMFAHTDEYYNKWSAVGHSYSSQDGYRDVLGPIVFGYPSIFVAGRNSGWADRWV